jgi:hypothetical protein
MTSSKSYILNAILAVSVISSSVSAQGILNSGFEDVTLITTNDGIEYLFPSNWKVFVDWMGCQPELGHFGRATDESYLGQYAILMETQTCTWNGSTKTSFFSPIQSYESSVEYTGQEYTERPEFLNFYYKFQKEGNDSALVYLRLFKYDSITPDISEYERIVDVALS